MKNFIVAAFVLTTGACSITEDFGNYIDRNSPKQDRECTGPGELPWECWYKISEVPGAGAHNVLVCATTAADAQSVVRQKVGVPVCSMGCVIFDKTNPQPAPKSQGDDCTPITACVDEGGTCDGASPCCSGLYCDQTCVL